MDQFVAYYRVSTKQQGKSGLGLEAQKRDVSRFIDSRGGELVAPPFVEVESGKNDHRPELEKAISRCKETGSKLLIAKLDRLSRNAGFIFKLRDELHRAGVDFVACDMPEANTLTIGIMASLAQQEREMISERTKKGLQEAKARGVELGTPENLTDTARRKGIESIKANAKENRNWRHAFHFIKPLREKGLSYGKIADRLNSEGYRTRTGKKFHATQVSRVFKRYNDTNK